MRNTAREAVILDRDGVILEERDHLWKIEEAHFLPGAVEGLRYLNDRFSLFIATNQAGIAKGLYTEGDFLKLNTWMLGRLRAMGVSIAGVYYCPHHPEATMSGYRLDCDCRKPRPGLLRRIQQTHRLDPRQSWVIGDKTSDIAAGTAVGMRTLLVLTGYAGADGLARIQADAVANDLRQAADIITTKSPG